MVAARKAAKAAGASDSIIHKALRSHHRLDALAEIERDYLVSTGGCPLSCRKLPGVKLIWSVPPQPVPRNVHQYERCGL